MKKSLNKQSQSAIKANAYHFPAQAKQEADKAMSFMPPPLQLKGSKSSKKKKKKGSSWRMGNLDWDFIDKSKEEIKKEGILYAKKVKKDPLLARIISGLKPEDVTESIPWMLGSRQKKPHLPYRIKFKPKPQDGFDLLQRLYGAGPSLDAKKYPQNSVEVIYENDGNGINPGGGTDQGPTATFMILYKRRSKSGRDKFSVGFTIMDMHTPAPPLNHPVPPGKKKHETVYRPKEKGPYSGISAVHFGVTFFQKGGWKLNFINSVGVDSPAYGKLVQDFIHLKISDSPLFPWQGNKRLFAQTGINATYARRFKFLDVGGKFIFSGGARAGTHGAEADISAKMDLDFVKLRGRKRPLWNVEIGGKGNAHYRRGSGRKSHKGLEAGFIGGLRLNLGRRWTLYARYEDIVSSDPVKKVKRGRNGKALAQKGSPISVHTGKGHNRGSIGVIFHW